MVAPAARLSLPSSVVGFLRARERLSEQCASHPWGTVVRNASLPHVHDANRALVFGALTPAVSELRDAMREAQRTVAVEFTQVEVIDLESRAALVAELAAWLGPPPDVFVMMSTSATPRPRPPTPPPPLTIAERPFPDAATWLGLIITAHSDEDALPADVLRELVTRDTSVSAVAGTRFFTAARDGEVIAFASLLTLRGVGLIDNVATLPAHRRQGAAAAVVGAVVAASAAAGNDHTCLFTHEGSDAQRLYERLGLRSIARAAQFRLNQPLPA